MSVDVEHATVSGGAFNTASASAATVGGGQSNSATGNWATVPGGSQNAAQGAYSFAAGRNAHALHDGSFVWSDNQPSVAFKSTTENQFRVQATGGAEFISGANVEGVSGVVLNPGGGAWLSMSDRNAKENLENVVGQEVLEAVVDLPISTWNYKTQDESIRHIGPMAQDFHAAFGVGADDRHIATIDADGVALATIQGLYQVVQEQQAQIEALEARIVSLGAD